jgi:hypothetical protein
MGMTLGVLEGIFNAFARTASGVVDTATAPIGSSKEPTVKPSMVDKTGLDK